MQMYPDQSLYPVDSVPAVVKRINNSLRRADQLNIAEGNEPVDYMLPIVADAEAGSVSYTHLTLPTNREV